jgi:hypothetical protein
MSMLILLQRNFLVVVLLNHKFLEVEEVLVILEKMGSKVEFM